MKKKLQVFVSSTYVDMRPERQTAVEVILEAGHIPAGMELFAAGDESQMETIRKWIDDSDVFMLILGGRYGSIDPKSKKSYIELEYDHAEAKKKPHFAVVMTPEAVKAKGSDAIEAENGFLMKEFRNRVTSKMCHMFNDANGLKVAVFKSLSRLADREDLSGWVRRSDVVDPKQMLEEINRVQGENVELRGIVDSLRSELGSIGMANRSHDIGSAISENAAELLLAAVKADGNISYHASVGDRFKAGEMAIVPKNAREGAMWKAAIEELREYRLIELFSAERNNETYRVRMSGYKIADEITAKKAASASPAAENPMG